MLLCVLCNNDTHRRNYTMPVFCPIKDRLIALSIPEPNSGCWIWAGCVNSDGYGAIGINGKAIGAHRVAYEQFVGPIAKGMHVLHRCDVRPCVNPDHLYLGTHADNMGDREQRGRANHKRGAEHPEAKLTEDQVRAIRVDPRLQRDIAASYGVSLALIGFIKTRRAWKHVA